MDVLCAELEQVWAFDKDMPGCVEVPARGAGEGVVHRGAEPYGVVRLERVAGDAHPPIITHVSFHSQTPPLPPCTPSSWELWKRSPDGSKPRASNWFVVPFVEHALFRG